MVVIATFRRRVAPARGNLFRYHARDTVSAAPSLFTQGDSLAPRPSSIFPPFFSLTHSLSTSSSSLTTGCPDVKLPLSQTRLGLLNIQIPTTPFPASPHVYQLINMMCHSNGLYLLSRIVFDKACSTGYFRRIHSETTGGYGLPSIDCRFRGSAETDWHCPAGGGGRVSAGGAQRGVLLARDAVVAEPGGEPAETAVYLGDQSVSRMRVCLQVLLCALHA